MATIDRTTVQFQDASATRIRRIGIVTLPASYATGGVSLTAAELALGKIDLFLPELATNGSVVRLLRYDYTNAKLKAFDLAGDEIANGTDLSTYSARFEAIGK